MANILTVDDSTSLRQMVRLTLCGAGHAVIEASDGEEGLARAEGADVDLVVTGVNMPRMDGITFIRMLRASPRFADTPILILTTEHRHVKRQAARAAGAAGWMMKPFDPEQLLATVSKLIGSPPARAGESSGPDAVTASPPDAREQADAEGARDRLAEIADGVEEISRQAQILALNATVATARGGELGDAYALVSAELRDLAAQTAGAAREIRAVVGDVAISGPRPRVSPSTERLIAGISDAVGALTGIATGIAAATRAQSTSAERIDAAVRRLEALAPDGHRAAPDETDEAMDAAELSSPDGVERRGPQRPWSASSGEAERAAPELPEAAGLAKSD